MKPFKYPQKQWVMATALLTVLAVNVSFNPYHAKTGSIDLAEKSTEFAAKSSKDRAAAREAKKKEFQKKQAAAAKKEKEKEKEFENENENEESNNGENDSVEDEPVEAKTKAEVGKDLSFEVVTPFGDADVTYHKRKDKGIAVVPKLVEGTICSTCGYETVVFSKNIDQLELKDLQRKILSYYNKKVATQTASEDIEETSAKEEKTEEKQTEVAEIDPFDGIEKKCSDKSDKVEELGCFKEEFLKALKNTRKSKTKMAGADIRTADALRFYQKNIKKRIVDIIHDARMISSRKSLSNLSGGFYSSLNSPDLLINETDSNEMITNVSDIFSELITEMPKKFDTLRNDVISLEEDIVRRQAKDFKDTQTLALTTRNYDQVPALTQQAEGLKNDLGLMKQEFYARNGDSLREALSYENINSSMYYQYIDNLREFDKNLTNGLLGQNNFLSGANTIFAPELGARISLQPGPRTILSSNPTISTRTGANASIIVPNNGSNFYQPNVIDRLNLSPNVEITNTQFAPFSPATAEYRDQAAAIRARMQR
ncbi:MAG: hypothetical protein ACXVCP_07625 [Bdellovibrio sp.]